MENDNNKLREVEEDPLTVIDTGGGTYVSGNVHTDGGDFIGRDLIVNYGIPVGLIIMIVVVMIIVAINQGWALSEKSQPILNPYGIPQTKMPGDIKIAIAPIHALNPELEETGREITEWLALRLDEDLSGELTNVHIGQEVKAALQTVTIWYNDAKDVSITPPIESLLEEDRAAFWAERLGATLVIYGHLDESDKGTPLSLYFYYAAPIVSNLPDISLGHHPFGESILIPSARYPLQARDQLNDNTDLEQRATALVWLTRALLKLKSGKGNSAGSLKIFQDAEQTLNLASWEYPDVSSVLYYFMGQTALQVPDLSTAERAFQAVIGHSDQIDEQLDIVLAIIGLGNYHYLSAQLYLLAALTQTEKRGPGFCLPTGSDVDESTDTCDIEFDIAEQTEIPDDYHPILHALLTEAIDQYEKAIKKLDYLDPDKKDDALQQTRNVAQVMLANAQRLSGEAYLNQFEDLVLTGTINQDLLLMAETHFVSSTNNFSKTTTLFEQTQEFVLVSYARYGLGIAQARQACIAGSFYGESEKASKIKAASQKNFRLCADQATQEDGNEDKNLANDIQCLCKEAIILPEKGDE